MADAAEAQAKGATSDSLWGGGAIKKGGGWGGAQGLETDMRCPRKNGADLHLPVVISLHKGLM